VISSLKAGFEAFNGSTAYNVVVPDFKVNDFRYIMSQINQLQSGDIFVWLGVIDKKLFDESLPALRTVFASSTMNVLDVQRESILSARTLFRKLRSKNVYTVYYQSEPVVDCQEGRWDVDEMWDFSFANMEMCEKTGAGPKQRYVPLAALPTRRTVQYAQPGPLLFFGQASFGTRGRCWAQLKSHLHDKLQMEYSAWNDDAYQTVLDRSNIYLNIHKLCGNSAQPITWRNAKLLNAHALIISEHSYPKDEEQFAGLIDFTDLEKIPDKYGELAAMSQTERQNLADSRAEMFSKRFAPEVIFQKAGIYDLMTARASVQ